MLTAIARATLALQVRRSAVADLLENDPEGWVESGPVNWVHGATGLRITYVYFQGSALLRIEINGQEWKPGVLEASLIQSALLKLIASRERMRQQRVAAEIEAAVGKVGGVSNA